MFGKNPQTAQFTNTSGALRVKEVFPTIQGEGPYAGKPATFIRLGGCNLKCTFCDTDFDLDKSPLMSKEELISLCTAHGNKLIVITGGEPFLQEIAPLISGLIMRRYKVQIETAGLLWQEGLSEHFYNDKITIVVSPKTPKIHPLIMLHAKAFKYIVSSRYTYSEEGIPICNTQEEDGVAKKLAWNRRPDQTFMQPMEAYTQIGNKPDKEQTEKNIQTAIKLCMDHGYRLSLQLHKILGLP